MRLAAFQKKFIIAIYDNPHRTARALLSIARKNGKSALIAAILLAHIVGPEAVQNSQVVSGAMSRDQAALIFKLASKMIALNGKLALLARVNKSDKTIVGVMRNVEYKPISAEASTAHGLSPVLAILDEVGQIRGPTSDFIEAITTAQGAYENPLLIAISTSAPSDADMFSQWIDDAKRSGDVHTVCHEYRAPDNCDLLDMEAIKAANPGLGIFLSLDVVMDGLRRAQRMPALEASARNLHLNQRIALDGLWLSPTVWRENGDLPDIATFRNSDRVACALDLSSRIDITAAVIATRHEGVTHLLPFCFTPANGLMERAKRDRAPYDLWVREGKLIAVPGSSVSYQYVAEFLRDALRDLQVNITHVVFDRWRIDAFKSEADKAGFAAGAEWSEVGQGYKDMAPRVEYFAGELLETSIRHGNHALLNMSAANAIAVRDPAGNAKLDKAKSYLRIDPLVAAVMAAYAVGEGATTGGTPYLLII